MRINGEWYAQQKKGRREQRKGARKGFKGRGRQRKGKEVSVPKREGSPRSWKTEKEGPGQL